MSSKLDCVEEVLKRYQYKRPYCDNISRQEILTCENELPHHNDVLVIRLWYNPMSGLMKFDNILSKKKGLKDVTEEYEKNNYVKDYVKGMLEAYNKEITRDCK